MKITLLAAGDRPSNCRSGFKQFPAEKKLRTIPIACALLVSVTGSFLQAGEVTNKLVGKEANVKDISGVYALVAVDGKKVPATVSHEGTNLQVRSGTFTISADGRCLSKVTFVPPSGAESTREVKATSTREGPKLKMHWEGAGMTTGTIEGNTFTMENEGMVFVYRK